MFFIITYTTSCNYLSIRAIKLNVGQVDFPYPSQTYNTEINCPQNDLAGFDKIKTAIYWGGI